MPVTAFPDEWLAQSLEGLVTPEILTDLRAKAEAGRTLWEMLVAQKVSSDEQILQKLSARFRLKIADVAHLDPKAGAGAPLPRAAAPPHRFLPRARDVEPLRPGCREGAGVRDRARDPHAAARAVQDRREARRDVSPRESDRQTPRGDGRDRKSVV